MDLGKAAYDLASKAGYKIDEHGVSISKYSADPTGTIGSHGAFTSVLTTSEDIVFIPKGVYLIEQNITIPANKKLVFARNARLKPANGVIITINGTWEAGDDDWIFDFSLGGTIGGSYKVSAVFPQWCGAKGGGVTDDTKAFKWAMDVCNNRHKMCLTYVDNGYLITDTIINKSKGIYGVSPYADSSNLGVFIYWKPTIVTDLKPCIQINLNARNITFSDFSIRGNTSYSLKTLVTDGYMNKANFDLDKYEMFHTGTSAIEVTGKSTPIFRNLTTTGVKVGLYLNNDVGHTSSYDCSWNGLIGVYCRINAWDYFFQGGGIAGTFCGILMGCTTYVGYNGGIGLTMQRVHMGFSPYAIYQCIDNQATYDSQQYVGGLIGTFDAVRFEQIGEAAIKLLPKSKTDGLFISGFGMTWSTGLLPNADFVLPVNLITEESRQKYGAWFGYLGSPNATVVMDDYDAGGLKKSTAISALGTAYIYNLIGDVMIKGLNPNQVTVASKYPSTDYVLTTPQAVEDSIHAKVHNPISHGQLAKNPEIASNWITTSGVLSVITDLSQLPVGLSAEVKSFLGKNIKIIKITPDGTNSPTLNLPSLPPSIADIEREICFEYFIMCETQSTIRSSLGFVSLALYDQSYIIPPLEWVRVRNRGLKPRNNTFSPSSFFQLGSLSKTAPSYIVGVMVSYDRTGSYSPHNHAYTNVDFEIGDKNGLILTDTVSGNRGKLTLSNGSLQTENMAIKTKAYSENGIPWKLVVSDSGVWSSVLDALVYDSFDREDSATSMGTATLGGTWTATSGTWGISSNEAYCANGVGQTTRAIMSSLGTSDYNVGCSIRGQLLDPSNYSRPGIVVMYTNFDNNFNVDITNNSLQIVRRISASETTVASTSFTPSDNTYYKMNVAVKGDIISVYLDGNLMLTYKLSPADIIVFGSSKIVGLKYRGSGTITIPARFNNFVVEKI